MSAGIKETKCNDCGKLLYEIEGKFATKRDGTKLNFLQKYEDKEGTIEHWSKCEIGKAKYEAKKAQEKLAKIQGKTAEQTPAQTKTIEATKIAQNAIANNGIGNKTAEQKAQEYIDKFGVDNAQNIRDPEPNPKPTQLLTPRTDEPIIKNTPIAKVTEIMSPEQLNALQLQRIENKLDAIIKHFKIEYSVLAKDTLDNFEVPE